MTEYEASLLKDFMCKEVKVCISDLPQGYEGTLVYGYTCGRDTFHLYVKDGSFHRIIYNSVYNTLTSYDILKDIPVEECVPDKRVYQQDSQYFFLKLLNKYGCSFSLTKSNTPADYTIKLGEFVERAKKIEDF